MIALLAGVAFCGLTLYALRGGMADRHGLTLAGFEPQSIVMGGLAVVAAGLFLGPLYGLALVLAVMIHEFGHVAAYRVIGHHDARFRLVPLFGGVAISDQLPASQDKDFFVSLMGPGISVAPMVLGYGLSGVLYDAWPLGSDFFYAFAGLTAALNFFNLLPFWPLDGGKCLRGIAYAFWPGLARVLTVAMSAGLAAAAVAMQSLVLLVFALLGAQSLIHAEAISSVQRPMGRWQAVLAAGAYLFTAAAHLAGGFGLILRYL